MSTEILLMASPGSTRTLEAAIEQSPSLPVKHLDPKTPPPQALTRETESSSRASTPLSSVMDVDNMSTEPSSPPSAQASAAKPEVKPQKQKLTFAEKEVLRIEKQFQAQQKAEEKARKEAQKEADKREKEEKKRLEAEEREAKRLQKELEKTQRRKEQDEAKEEKRKAKEEKDAIKQAEIAAKEAEKKAKEEEKAKKERSQMRLNAFFVKNAPSTSSAASSRRNSVSSIPGSPLKKELTTVVEDFKKELSEYEKAFPPFFVKEHVTLAPQTRFEYDEARLEQTREQLDACLAQQLERVPSLKRSFEDATHEPFAKRRKLGSKTATVKELISRINSESTTIDLTESGTSKKDAFSLLQTVPTKYLRHAEDVRPPYIGTYTKDPIGCSVQRLCRKPFTRALPGVNYDYDSEAEWEEPEEGDECGSDEEDSELEDEDEDMAGFLDDDEDAPKRRNVMGDMDPMFTGIFWQEPKHRRGAVKVSYGTSTLDLNNFRISPLLVEATGPIDPFSTAYWKAPEPERLPDSTSMAPPPRQPLNPLLGTNTRLSTDPVSGLTLKHPTSGGTAAPALQKTKASAKPFPPDLLDDFKREIDGSDLSKIGLVEVLKKRFPQITGKTIQESLPLVAKRDGKNQAEKKWVLI